MNQQELVTTHIVAGVVLKQDDKFLLVQENRPGSNVHGLWNLPAGKVDVGNSIEETAIREAKEETGLDVELVRKLGIFQDNAQTPPKHAFEARIISGSLRWPQDEILDAKWFTWLDIQNMRAVLRDPWVTAAVNIIERGV